MPIKPTEAVATRSTGITEYDRDVFESYLFVRIDAYLPYIKKWFDNYYEHVFPAIGTFRVADAPNGLYYKFCYSEKHSAVQGLQAFTFIPVNQMNLPRAKTGVRNMVQEVIGPDFYEYKGFRIKIKQNLVNTCNAGMFLVVIPEEFYKMVPTGRFMYVTDEEQNYLARKVVPRRIQTSLEKYLIKYGKFSDISWTNNQTVETDNKDLM